MVYEIGMMTPSLLWLLSKLMRSHGISCVSQELWKCGLHFSPFLAPPSSLQSIDIFQPECKHHPTGLWQAIESKLAVPRNLLQSETSILIGLIVCRLAKPLVLGQDVEA
jgi:hypothetical protein